MNQPRRRTSIGDTAEQDLPSAGNRPTLRALRGGHLSDPGSPSFEPMPVSASSFENRRIERTDTYRLDIVPTRADRLFGTSMAIAGNSLLAATFYKWPIAGPMDIAVTLIAISLIIAAIAFRRIGSSATLDVKQGELLRRGGLLFGASTIRQRESLDGVTAVQLLESSLLSEDAECPVYQVNLVKHDGSRVHVTPHTDVATARETAATVADMFGVDVMEAPARHETPS